MEQFFQTTHAHPLPQPYIQGSTRVLSRHSTLYRVEGWDRKAFDE